MYKLLWMVTVALFPLGALAQTEEKLPADKTCQEYVDNYETLVKKATEVKLIDKLFYFTFVDEAGNEEKVLVPNGQNSDDAFDPAEAYAAEIERGYQPIGAIIKFGGYDYTAIAVAGVVNDDGKAVSCHFLPVQPW